MARALEAVVERDSMSPWRGVGVFLCSAKNQDHVGLVVESGGLAFLHLHQHDSLRLEPLRDLFAKYPFKKALLTRPELPDERAAYLSAVCLRIFKKQGGKLPFGFGDWRRAFSEERAYVPTKGRTGLTCATFVLSVLELAGYVLFDFDTWQYRNEDTAWQISMVAHMRAAGVNPDHIEAVDTSVDGLRFRPAEVAAGFVAIPTTLTQAEAESRGTALRGRVI